MGALSFSTEASVIVNGAEQDIEMSAVKRACFEAPVPHTDWVISVCLAILCSCERHAH
jgi:hypothetical protein